ncbi:hypothetical protein RNJ44_03644 [Nakaseomyces bracarensis]|uniref:RRM domain-containing protein n=1 Tax=Nakaseomyces bracarensis TaxID=273131 RepID=A0ABR4NXQ8_9SACH
MSRKPVAKKRRFHDDDKVNKRRKVAEPKNTLHVSNLNEKTNTKKLRYSLYMLFSIYGEVLKVQLNFRRLRSQAFVTMRTTEEATLAKASLDKELFFNKELQVEFSNNNTVQLE